MTDKTLTCRDCGAEFVFTTGEQEFYKEGSLMSQQDVLLVEELKKNNKTEDSFDIK